MADETAELLTRADFGRIGGQARAKKLTCEQRRESAIRAARARWAKTHNKPDPPPSPTSPPPDSDLHATLGGAVDYRGENAEDLNRYSDNSSPSKPPARASQSQKAAAA